MHTELTICQNDKQYDSYRNYPLAFVRVRDFCFVLIVEIIVSIWQNKRNSIEIVSVKDIYIRNDILLL